MMKKHFSIVKNPPKKTIWPQTTTATPKRRWNQKMICLMSYWSEQLWKQNQFLPNFPFLRVASFKCALHFACALYCCCTLSLLHVGSFTAVTSSADKLLSPDPPQNSIRERGREGEIRASGAASTHPLVARILCSFQFYRYKKNRSY